MVNKILLFYVILEKPLIIKYNKIIGKILVI